MSQSYLQMGYFFFLPPQVCPFSLEAQGVREHWGSLLQICQAPCDQG